MKDPIQFNETEQFLVSYYRTPSVSGWLQTLAAEGGYLTASILFISIYISKDDSAWGVLGYLILFYRVVCGILQARRWNPSFQGIINKYEARIAELTSELEKRDSQ